MKKTLFFLILSGISCFSCACDLDTKALKQDQIRLPSGHVSDEACWLEVLAQIRKHPHQLTLDLSNQNWGDDKMAAALGRIPVNFIKSLNLSGNQLQGTRSLWHSIRHVGALDALHLGYNPIAQGLCVNGLSTLALGQYQRLSLAKIGHFPCKSDDIKRVLATLRWLDLSNQSNKLGGLSAWLHDLPQGRHLTTLILNQYSMTPQEFDSLCYYLGQKPALQELELGHIDLTDAEWNKVLPLIGHLPHLRKLSLFNNQLHDHHIKVLTTSLGKKSPLRWLDLSQNKLQQGGIQSLAKWLKTSRLHTLSLRLNHLSDEDAKALAAALLDRPSLKSLDLSHMKLVDWKPVLQALLQAQDIESLSLAGNSNLSHAAQSLADFLQGSHSLREIDLSQNPWLDRKSAILATGLGENKSLEHVYMIDSRLQQSSAKKIATAVDDHPYLMTLSLDHNDISLEGMRQLNEMLFDESPMQSLLIDGS